MIKPASNRETQSPTFSSPVLADLDRIAHLEEGWDSYGGRSVAPSAMKTARALIPHLARSVGSPDVLGARADGGLLAEWSRGPRSLEVHIEPTGVLGYLFEDTTTNEVIESDIASQDTIERLMRRVIAQ